MSLRQEVVDLVEELCGAVGVSGDDLMPHFPEFTRDQVFQALQNAKWDKKILIVEPAKATRAGKTQAKYGPVPRVEIVRPAGPRPVCSVWELGIRAGAAA